ncbi:protein BANP-like [Ornithodoros turicata]|uniref:protein BANP-like n=1 Tax=Ornithodoros turicata TaxID=34597 RepID=UPI00313912A5
MKNLSCEDAEKVGAHLGVCIPSKRPRRAMAQPLGTLLQAFKDAIFSRLEVLEKRVDILNDEYQALEEKVNVLSAGCQMNSTVNGSLVGYLNVLCTVLGSNAVASLDEAGAALVAGSSVTLITLNTEADFPNGSWLGDEGNPDMRVRCPILPTTLFHINTTCTTPEKMALTLLDHLFDRETQARSNISGSGKHKKQQLDPLMIYGIRCHLVHMFDVNSSDWDRIKLNIDSKCRTAFRRKKKGLPLAPKVVSHSTTAGEAQSASGISGGFGSSDAEVSDDSMNSIELVPQASEFCTFSLQTVEDNATEGSTLAAMVPEGQVICTEHGDFQVVHATPEQIAQIQQTHQLQILTDGRILAMPVDSGSAEDAAASTILQKDDLAGQ